MKAQHIPRGVVAIGALTASLRLVAGEIYLPTELGEARTPETRTLSAEEETRAMERDWLFQAMGEPLLQRSAKELGWARELAARLAGKLPAAEVAVELRALSGLEERLQGVAAKAAAEAKAMPAWQSPPDGKPSEGWIWYPEGKPSENAPAAVRFFRSKFEVPGPVRRAQLSVAADDACEVFLNGTRIGAHDTWQHAARFAVENQLKQGTNVLAVRAENKPANSLNPAGLIVSLTLTLADGKLKQGIANKF